MGISYIFAGKKDLDLSLALKKLFKIFGIKRILLEGGSIINGAFLKSDLVDELSLVVVPLIANKEDKSLFNNSEIKKFKLIEVKEISDNGFYLKYRR